MSKSKRYQNSLEKFDPDGFLSGREALEVVKSFERTKFDESIDTSLLLNLKSKKEELTLRTIANLPNGNGKKIKVAVLCEESKLNDAKASGAEYFEAEKLISDITSGKIYFDKLIATPAMMPKMGKLGKILGPKGLMPNPKLGTVTNNIKTTVKSIKEGQIEIKSDKDGNLEIKNLPAGEFEFQIWQEKAGYIQQVTQDGSTVEWARGRVKIKIEDGKTTDFGTIVIGADQFK